MRFSEIKKEVDLGLAGNTISVYTGFKKLGKYITIRRNAYHLIGSNSGAGKSAFADNFYVLNPIRWLLKERAEGRTDVKYKVYLWAMERKKEHRYAKWVCQRMFQKYGILIDVEYLLSLNGQRNKLSREHYEKFMEMSKEIDDMGEMIEVFGRDNPTGVYNDSRDFLLSSHGRMVDVLDEEGKPIPIKIDPGKFKKRFEYTSDKEIVCVYLDHFQQLKGESREGRSLIKKDLIEKMDEYLSILRDKWGCMCVGVSQFNRGVHSMARRKDLNLAPQEDDFRDTSRVFDSSDVVIGMLNPYKYQDFDHLGYDIHQFTSPIHGANRFRALYLLKNSFGPDNLAFGNLFYGENGLYKELPKPAELVDLQKFIDVVKSERSDI